MKDVKDIYYEREYKDLTPVITPICLFLFMACLFLLDKSI